MDKGFPATRTYLTEVSPFSFFLTYVPKLVLYMGKAARYQVWMPKSQPQELINPICDDSVHAIRFHLLMIVFVV